MDKGQAPDCAHGADAVRVFRKSVGADNDGVYPGGTGACHRGDGSAGEDPGVAGTYFNISSDLLDSTLIRSDGTVDGRSGG